MQAHRALIGLGSNMEGPLGSPKDYIQAALEQLASEPSIELIRSSPLYRSAPWGNPDQDDFVNAVAELATELGPLELLDRLLSVEDALGRRRGDKWGPRLIDLDLLSFDDLEIEEKRLSLPHPHMHQRAFVLLPLLNIDPGFIIPGKGLARHFLDNIGDAQRLERL